MALLAQLKRYGDALNAVRFSRMLISRERWSREELTRHQHRELDKLVRYAMAHSPFYRDLYRDLAGDEVPPLDALPIINKPMVMDNFDRLVTDERIRLDDLRAHLESAEGDALYLDEYRALSTSGTTGLTGIFSYSRREWSIVLADTLRWQHMISVSPRFPKRVRIATIGAHNPAHVSYRLSASGNFGLYKMLCLDATTAIATLVDDLNDFQPEVLLPYPSVAALLAQEQLLGRLRIQPRVVSTHSEVLTADMAAVIQQSWGEPPFDHYGLSEHPNCGCACGLRRGVHLFEDLFIAEVVDEHNRPVPAGTSGHKLLLTNLYNYTQPLIRYEVSDMITIDAKPCPCGRPFRNVSKIGGRNDDIIYLAGLGTDRIAVHPLHFYDAMETLTDIRQYQVIEKQGAVGVRIVPREGADQERLRRTTIDRLSNSLKSAGVAKPMVHVDIVDTIERPIERMGKVKLVLSSSRPPDRQDSSIE
ncbi:MAG: phenylacetate--CoA ligase family protein [Alphaproteobacteria bacterium]|nr:phenylacetate--CoA ligase family protein [Alphaproteobacteria bacterium]